jgi:hypothetical protein
MTFEIDETVKVAPQWQFAKNRVQVFSKTGKLLGDVSRNASSIGASKVAGSACQLRRMQSGAYAWIAY